VTVKMFSDYFTAKFIFLVRFLKALFYFFYEYMDKDFSINQNHPKRLQGTEGGGVTLCRQADTLLQTKILGIHDWISSVQLKPISMTCLFHVYC
jgi:hypothetical protein